MASHQILYKFYTECVNCALTRKQCPKAWKDRRIGMIPRGFELPLSRRPKLLVVGKNPGHPLDEFGECQLYIGKRGKDLLDAWLGWRDHLLKMILATSDDSLKYHKNRNRYLRFILGHSKRLEPYSEYSRRTLNSDVVMKDYAKIMRSTAMTNLFKCSTRNERQKLKASDVAPCYNKFFSKEIHLMRPRAILAFGNEVYEILRRLDTERNLPFIVAIKHPSYFYLKQSEAEKLKEIKESLNRCF